MQQFSFNPAPFNRFYILIIIYLILQGVSLTLRQIRINGNLDPQGIQ